MRGLSSLHLACEARNARRVLELLRASRVRLFRTPEDEEEHDPLRQTTPAWRRKGKRRRGLSPLQLARCRVKPPLVTLPPCRNALRLVETALQRPWSLRTHFAWPQRFRDGAKALLSVALQKKAPAIEDAPIDVITRIFGLLPRGGFDERLQPAEQHRCVWCHAKVKVRKRCKACKQEWYCSRAHQVLAWKAHRRKCKRMVAEREALEAARAARYAKEAKRRLRVWEKRARKRRREARRKRKAAKAAAKQAAERR